MLLLAAPLRALAQFDDPAFLGVMWRSVACAVLALAGLAGLLVWGGSALAPDGGWLGWIGGLVGGVGAALLAFYFFLPLATVIAALFVGRVAQAVERRFYPALPPPCPAPLAEQTWDGLALGLRVLGCQVLTLLLLLTPLAPVAAPLGWLVAAWAVGRGLFVAVAMQRAGRADAVRCYHHARGAVLAQGAWITAGSLVPVLNLFVPVLGIAAMVHVLHGLDRSRVVP
jgi:uncharacterized protein involved in cysteine biosynthesis